MMQPAGASSLLTARSRSSDNALKEALTVYKDMVDKGILAEYTDWDSVYCSMNDGKGLPCAQWLLIMSRVQGRASVRQVGYRHAWPGWHRWCHQLRKLRRRKLGCSLQPQEHRLAFDFLKSTSIPVLNCMTTCRPTPVPFQLPGPLLRATFATSLSSTAARPFAGDIAELRWPVPADCGAYYLTCAAPYLMLPMLCRQRRHRQRDAETPRYRVELSHIAANIRRA